MNMSFAQVSCLFTMAAGSLAKPEQAEVMALAKALDGDFVDEDTIDKAATFATNFATTLGGEYRKHWVDMAKGLRGLRTMVVMRRAA